MNTNNTQRVIHNTTKYFVLFFFFAFLGFMPKSNAKEMADYGKVWVVKISATATTAADVQFEIQELIEIMKTELVSNPTNVETSTLLFPLGNYPVVNGLSLTFTKILSTTSSISMNNKIINIIGLQKNYSEFDLAFTNYIQGSPGTIISTSAAGSISLNTYINNNYSRNIITSSVSPTDVDFLTSAPTAFPKIIRDNPLFMPTPYDPNDPFKHSNQLLWISNSAIQTPLNLSEHQKNTINIMGIEFSSQSGSQEYKYPDNNSTTLDLYPDCNNTTAPGGHVPYFSLYVRIMYKVYIDNIRITKLWGSGLDVHNERVETQTTDYKESTETIVKDNVVEDTWGAICNQVPATHGISFIGVFNGTVTHNIVNNNLTSTNQIAPGVGICAGCEENLNIDIFENWVNGYEINYWSEGNGGGVLYKRNRSTGSEHGMLISANNHTHDESHPKLSLRMEDNYFSNENIPGSFTYIGQYVDHNSQIFFDGFSPHQNFTTFKGNTVILKEELYTSQKECPDPQLCPIQRTPTTIRNLLWAPSQDYIEDLCNNYISVDFQNRETNIIKNQPHGWQINNLYNSLDAVNTNCSIAQNNSTFFNIQTPYNCSDNTTLTNCERDYEVNSEAIGNGLSIDYSLHDACDLMSGTISFRVNGGTPPYKFVYDADHKMGLSAYLAGTFTNVQEGQHTLTVTDASSVPLVGTFVFDMGKNPGVFYTNTNTAYLIQIYTPINSPTQVNYLIGKRILVDGTLTVNANFTFTDCIFYLTPGSKIYVQAGYELTIDECELKSACEEMWEGIIAEDASSKIIIHNSYISDMLNGVQAKNGAQTEIRDNSFIDNYISIQFVETPVGYATGINGNKGKVLKNTFTSSGNHLLVPHDNLTRPYLGIQVIESSEIQIGELTSGSNNSFKHLTTGILFKPTVNIYTGDMYVLNNTFEDIKDVNVTSTIDKINQLYATQYGAGIFMELMADIKVHVEGVNKESVFLNCDKAIAGNSASVDVTESKITNCLVGIGINDAYGKTFAISKNNIDDVMLGIQLMGDVRWANIKDHSGNMGSLNILSGTPLTAYAVSPIHSVGIDVGFWSNGHNADVQIANNDINLEGQNSTGIYTHAVGNKTLVWNNKVSFLNAVPVAIGGISPIKNNLTGIRADLGDGNRVHENIVYGTSANCASTSAISLNRNRNIGLSCNAVNNTQLGIGVTGNCATANDRIVNNTMNNHVYGLMTMPSVLDQGNLGDIGLISTQDNNNTFLGSYSNSNGDKTYRWWSNSGVIPASQNKIYTMLSFNNGSNFSNGSFLNQFTPNPYICDNGNINDGDVIDDHTFGMLVGSTAENIIDGDIVFDYNPEVSQWIAERDLYTELARDSITRMANNDYMDFYSNRLTEPMGELYKVEQRLNELLQIENITEIATAIQNAKQINNAVQSSLPYEEHLKNMNAILFKVLEQGRNVLMEAEKEQIYNLAHSCPAVGGLGVYKARQLNSYYEPLAFYNDYQFCSPANKNSEGLYDDLLSLLNGEEQEANPNSLVKQSDEENIIVYPIPTNDRLHFTFLNLTSQEKTIKIHDLMGRQLVNQIIRKDSTTCSIEVSKMFTGLYTYSIETKSKSFTGKFNIIK